MKNEIKTTIKTVSFINAEMLYQDFLNLPDEERCKFLRIIVGDKIKTKTTTYKNLSEYSIQEKLSEEIKNRLFTSKEAIEYLEISKSNFLKLIKSNKIVPIKTVNKNNIFSLDDLRELKESIELIKS